MPSDGLIAESHNVEEVVRAFTAVPEIARRFLKTVLFRFARRVARRTKREYLKGAPGIEGGPWARVSNKNIRGFTVGQDLTNLKAITKASRIVRTHIEGAVITPRQAGMLYLSKKTGKLGEGAIFGRVKSVTIPARIPFEQVWRQEIPKAQEQALAAAERALRLSLEQRLKVASLYVNKILSHD